jgi:hypothetical protein
MKQRKWSKWGLVPAFVASVAVATTLGYGAMAAQKRTVEERVTDLETKLKTLELKVQHLSAELARTPKLGMQTAK